jgi:hypothetical protein
VNGLDKVETETEVRRHEDESLGKDEARGVKGDFLELFCLLRGLG